MNEGSPASRVGAARLPASWRSRRSMPQFGNLGVDEPRWADQVAVLITDLGGRITGCSPAAIDLLGRSSEAMVGDSVKALIPGLPISPDTPGYNLAYAGFHRDQPEWLAHVARSGDDSPILLDVGLGHESWKERRFIVLTLRRRSSAGQTET